MTKRAKRKRRQSELERPRPILLLMQVQCASCGRYRLKAGACWFCAPAWPPHCHCADSSIQRADSPTCGGHIHLEHALLERLSQLDYESIDESILLPTENWPASANDVIDFEHEDVVGIANGGKGDPGPMRFHPPPVPWREAPEYKAFLARYPGLRVLRVEDESFFRFFDLTPSEGDVWALDSAGYVLDYIAKRLGYQLGGVEALLDSVRSKVAAKLARLDKLSEHAV